ncbi:MAG: hypothetical protein ACSLEL_00575 [Candidatus Malihini olakiniferum]
MQNKADPAYRECGVRFFICTAKISAIKADLNDQPNAITPLKKALQWLKMSASTLRYSAAITLRTIRDFPESLLPTIADFSLSS